MQEKQDQTPLESPSQSELLSDDVIEDGILSFMKPKELGPIRLATKRLNFLSEDRYQSNRLLDYIDKAKNEKELQKAEELLKSYPKILKHVEYQERFIHSCLKEGNTDKINVLLKHRPDFIFDKRYEPLMGSCLLKYGVKANQKAAELLITENPSLLLFKGDVVDDSGRYFKNVSFLQVITWCLDVLYMGNMVHESLLKDEEDEKIRIQLSQQLEEQMSKGLSFELKIGDYLPETEKGQAQKKRLIAGIKKLIELKYLNYEFKEGSDDILIIKNESHFDLTPLVKALQYYADHYDGWSGDECQEFWCTVVGLLQTLLPLYIRQHYCDPDEAFYPKPTFDKKEFKRCLDFNNWVSNDEKLLDCSAFGLGLDYGILRALVRGSAVCAGCWRAGSWRRDSIALSALFERRTRTDLVSLIKLLKQPLTQLEHTSKLEF